MILMKIYKIIILCEYILIIYNYVLNIILELYVILFLIFYFKIVWLIIKKLFIYYNSVKFFKN